MNPRSPLAEAIAVDVDLNEPLLTADQVARLLAIPRSSVYEYARGLPNPRWHRAAPAVRSAR